MQHAPALHRPPVHAVPSVTLLRSAQTGVPLLHSTAPSLHWLGFVVHAAPWLHATQLPVLHTPPGHDTPVITFPVSRHTAAPVEQSIAPVRQAFDGVQLIPATHGTHDPLGLHTPPAHAVPAGLALASTHTGLPEAQVIVPL